jgi:hypothetical protein
MVFLGKLRIVYQLSEGKATAFSIIAVVLVRGQGRALNNNNNNNSIMPG